MCEKQIQRVRMENAWNNLIKEYYYRSKRSEDIRSWNVKQQETLKDLGFY